MIRHHVISYGGNLAGFVRQCDAVFEAINLSGHTVGTFAGLREAVEEIARPLGGGNQWVGVKSSMPMPPDAPSGQAAYEAGLSVADAEPVEAVLLLSMDAKRGRQALYLDVALKLGISPRQLVREKPYKFLWSLALSGFEARLAQRCREALREAPRDD